MKSRDMIFIVIVIAVVGGLYFLSTKNKAKPMSATTPEHLTVKAREDCLRCHLPETLAALEQQHKHPGKWRDERVSCLLCHPAPQGGAKAGNSIRASLAYIAYMKIRSAPPVLVVESNLEFTRK
jgi:hypothetical protein